jgi:hypothetical protein
MTYAPTRRFAVGLSALSLVALSLGSFGCAGGSSSGGTGGNAPTGTGGNNSGAGGSSTGTGGRAPGTGGSGPGTGGSISTGGTPGTGGSASTGGAPGTGGSGTGGSVGSGGTGGSTSTGGSTGTGGSAGKSGSGGAAGAGATTFFTDDFESDMMGKQPAGFDNLIAYNFNATNPQGDISTPTSSGSGAVADNTHTHNGSKMAVHFHGSSNPAFLELKLASGINHLYSRVWVYSSLQLGNGPSSDNHETLLGITGDPGSVNNQVRFGMIKGAIGTNQSATDDISPLQAKWYMPPMITANAWHCIELELDGTAAYNVLNAYSDGTLVHAITAGTDWQNGALKNTPNWLSGIFTDFMFGYQSFSSTTADVWMDDLALSTTGRIGCN